MTVIESYILYCLLIIFTVLIVTFSRRIRNSKYKKLSNISFWLAILIPWLIAANRDGVGTDFFSYVSIYNRVTGNGDLIKILMAGDSIEPGWVILNYLVKIIFNDDKYVFVLSSLIILFFNFFAVYRYRDRLNISTAILIFMCTLYNTSFNIIRQSLAMSILLFSLKYIEEKKFYKFLIIVLLASSFHYTALIFLPLYWFLNADKSKLNWLKKGFLYLSCILLIVYFNTFFNFLINLGNGVFDKYNAYTLGDNGAFSFANIIIIRIPIIIIILLNYKLLKKKDVFMSELIFLYFMSLILIFLGDKAPHIDRISMYFGMIQIFILPSIIKNQKNVSLKYFLIIIISIYYIIIFTNNVLINNGGETIPYIWRDY